MSSSPRVGVSLVEAIQNNHIPLQDAAEDVVDRILLSNANNAATRQSQRDLLQSMVQSIDSVVRQIDAESHTIVADTFGSDFDSIIDVVKNLAAEIENVATIHSQVEQDNAFAFNGLYDFSQVYNQYESATVRHRELDTTVAILRDLQKWYQLVQKVQDELERTEIDSAHVDLLAANKIISNLKHQTQTLRILSKMNERTDVLTESLKKAFVQEWDQIISLQANSEASTLKVSENGQHLSRVVSDLIRYDLLQGQVSALARGIQQHFLQPLLQGSITLVDDPSLVAKKSDASTRRNPESILKDITTLVTYLSMTFSSTLLHPLISSLLPMLIDDVLSFLPLHTASSITELPALSSLVNAVAHLETHIVNLGWATETPLSKWAQGTSIWFSNRQSTVLLETRKMVVCELQTHKTVLISSGIDIGSTPLSLLTSAVGQDGQMQVEKKKEPVDNDDDDDEPDAWGLDTADEEVEEPTEINRSVDTESWDWNDDNDDIKPLSEDPNSFPYTLSSIPDSLMEIVERILHEGTQLRSARYSEYSHLTNATEYSLMIISIFATWRAIIHLRRTEMSTGERMILSNDALHLTHRLVPHSDDPTVAIEMQRLSQCGQVWFNQELTRLKTLLSPIMSSTNGFVNSSHPEQSRKCTQAVESIKEELTSVSRLYHNILPPHKRRIAIGELLSFVLQYINTSLDLMEDISADESTFLIGLYTSIFSLEKLFSPFEASQFCAGWLKSQYIRELLEWRMVDIMESWREGLLQGVFERDEMVGWLKKLFQDSDARARNILEIQRG